MALEAPGNCGLTGLAPSRVDGKDMLSTPFVAGRGRGALFERQRRRYPNGTLTASIGRSADGQMAEALAGDRGLDQEVGRQGLAHKGKDDMSDVAERVKKIVVEHLGV